MTNNSLFNSFLIKEFSPGKDINDIKNKNVYHYTSPNSFLSIIQNYKIRFSDIRYMNDKSETVFFVKVLLEFCESNKGKYPNFYEAVNTLLEENDYSKIDDLSIDNIRYKEFPGLRFAKNRKFIFCTSTDADSLNMWNYYTSGNAYKGYNIGISVIDFLKTFDVNSINTADSFIVYHGSVIYSLKNQYKEIDNLANSVERILKNSAQKTDISRMAIAIRLYIETQGLFYKHESFKSENEYRFLISINENSIPHNENEAAKYIGEYNKKMCEGFYVKNGLIVPYMEVSLPNNVVSRINISPTTEFQIAKSSIKEILKIKGIKGTNDTEVPIHKSKIPVRF